MILLRLVGLLFLLLYIAPLGAGAAIGLAGGWPDNWRDADWTSAGIAPDPARVREPVVQVYAARAGAWLGIFSVHTWIVLKGEGAPRLTRYEVTAWGAPVRRDGHVPDGRWYSNEPEIVYELRGAAAAAIIPDIEKAVAAYPYNERGGYRIWPGPNSNTFVAEIARAVDGFDPVLPATALGKDYLGPDRFTATAPSKTGRQASLFGLAGIMVAREEGLEISIGGLVFAVDPADAAIALPSIGRIAWPR